MFAAHNNARWCDAVSRAHGGDTTFSDHLWLNHSPAPPFYPNAVTLRPGPASAALTGLRVLIDIGLPGAWTVKDSFCALDLRPHGFHVLFEAEWLGLPAERSLPAPTAPGLRWERVAGDTALAEWEAAWRGAPANADPAAPPRLFLPALLAHPDLAFLAGYQADRLVAGLALNRSDDGSGPVCGVSNLFLPAADGEAHRPGALLAARRLFPGLPLIGYEHSADLAAMRALDFDALGPLCVWVRDRLAPTERQP